MASQITSLTIVYSTVYSVIDQIKHKSSASLAFGEFPAQRASNSENDLMTLSLRGNKRCPSHTRGGFFFGLEYHLIIYETQDA